MPSACRPPRRGLVGGISAIPASHTRGCWPSPWFAPGAARAISAISATHTRTRGCLPGAWFAPGAAARAISAISASRFGRGPSARRDSTTAARGNAARRSRDRAGSAWLAGNGGARASRPKATDMVPNLSASVGRHTPQHCSVLSRAMRGLATHQGLWGLGLFAPRYIGSVVPNQGVTATHALLLSASPVIRRAIAYGDFRRLDRSAKRGAKRPSLYDKRLVVERRSLHAALRASVETTVNHPYSSYAIALPSYGGCGPRAPGGGNASVEAPLDFRSVHCRRCLCGLPPPCPPPYDGGGDDSE
jgi:hypothetical protein